MQKDREIKIRLSEEELNDLNEKASLVGYNRSQYIRSLIKNKVPKLNAQLEYQKLINEFNVIGKALTEIAINNKHNTRKIDVDTVIVDLDALIKKVAQQLRVPNK